MGPTYVVKPKFPLGGTGMLSSTSAWLGLPARTGRRRCRGAADATPGAVECQHRGDKVLRLDRRPFERPAYRLGLARLEAGEIGALGLAVLGDQGQGAMVFVGVGLGVGDGRAHPDPQQPAVRSHPCDVALHPDLVVIGAEDVGQIDVDAVPCAAQLERRWALDVEALRGCGERPIVQRDGVLAPDQCQAEESAMGRKELRQLALLPGAIER